MDFLGIGPLELFFIVIIALIVLGPNDMVKAGRTLGRFLRSIVTSPTWRAVQQTSREIRYLPNKLMREAGLEEIQKDLEKDLKENLPDANVIRRELDPGRIDLNQPPKAQPGNLTEWTTPPTIETPPAPPTSTNHPSSPSSISETSND